MLQCAPPALLGAEAEEEQGLAPGVGRVLHGLVGRVPVVDAGGQVVHQPVERGGGQAGRRVLEVGQQAEAVDERGEVVRGDDLGLFENRGVGGGVAAGIAGTGFGSAGFADCCEVFGRARAEAAEPAFRPRGPGRGVGQGVVPRVAGAGQGTAGDLRSGAPLRGERAGEDVRRDFLHQWQGQAGLLRECAQFTHEGVGQDRLRERGEGDEHRLGEGVPSGHDGAGPVRAKRLERAQPRQFSEPDLVLEIEQQEAPAPPESRVRLRVQRGQFTVLEVRGHRLRGELRQHGREDVAGGDHVAGDQLVDRGLQRAPHLRDEVVRHQPPVGARLVGDGEFGQATVGRVAVQPGREHRRELRVRRPRRHGHLRRAETGAGFRARARRAW
ncbi:hypothetical protein [Amycolatopsis sp. FDAARGOS 1241]|uniref:hypothetical protein n=1 Tax=Amycolatopsis sp. FDAARGOS 1241 TaxID=2778070 RepID=UPI001EF215AE|nr:hypothetical protein [Amycolatopsis sp. FDAARGOS 1241]